MDRLDVLMTEYLDGALDAAGADELAGRLEADAAARARFVALYADHRVLASQFAPDPEGAFARRVLAAVARDEDGFARSVMEDLARKSAARLSAVTTWARPRRRALVVAGAAAALLLAAGAAALLLSGPPPVAEPVPQARVASAVGPVVVERGGTTVPAKPGLALGAGDAVAVPSGASVAIRYDDGTRVEAEAGSRLSLETGPDGAEGGQAKRVVLRTGALSASVARQAPGRPMTFATPHAEAQVLGTRLALAAGAADTRLEVTEGRVRLTRSADRASVEVAEGSFAVASPGAPLDARPMDLVVKVLTPSVPDRFAARVGRLAAGSLMYTDRGYEITRLPDRLRGLTAILLPNAEKDWATEEYLAFAVNRPVDLFIGYDSRAFEGGARLPAWMRDYRDTGMRIFSRTAGDSTFHVYRKTHPAGRIALGGNHAGGDTGARENYLVIVAPKGAVAESPTRGTADEHR